MHLGSQMGYRIILLIVLFPKKKKKGSSWVSPHLKHILCDRCVKETFELDDHS